MGFMRIAIFVLALSVLAGCQKPPEDTGTAEICQAGELCRTVPPGKTSGQGNSDATTVCIAPLPANWAAARKDAACEMAFGFLLRAIATFRAFRVCRDVHQVRCFREQCPTDCQLTAAPDRIPTVFHEPNVAKCRQPQFAQAGFTEACILGIVGFNCTCNCPDCAPPEEITAREELDRLLAGRTERPRNYSPRVDRD